MEKEEKSNIIRLYLKKPDLKIISLKCPLLEMVENTGLTEEEIIKTIIEDNNIKGLFALEYKTDDKYYTKSKNLSDVYFYRYYYKNKLLRTIIKTSDEKYISINDFRTHSIITIKNGKIEQIFKYKNGKTEKINFDKTGTIKNYKISKYKNFTDIILLNLNFSENSILFESKNTIIKKQYDN